RFELLIQNFRGCVSLFNYQGSSLFSRSATRLFYQTHLHLPRAFFNFFQSRAEKEGFEPSRRY
ncbi:MAG: hypothetical protein ACLS7P_04045, partial [Blautia sp.]